MNTQDPTLAARFFFRNCAVSLHLPGEMRISRTLTPGPDDIILDRDFTPAGSPSEFIGGQSDFYRFLDLTSSTNSSLFKKLTAIGYMLCNKLPRNGRRCRAFICANEDVGSYANGKSLFSRAVAQFCNTVWIDARNKSVFWLSPVTEATNLLILEDLSMRANIYRFMLLCTDDWTIRRKAKPSLYIPHEKAPYLLLTTNTPVTKIRSDASFRRRFGVLAFSAFFGPDNSIRDYFGHSIFHDWDVAQWHMFDNLMFYCVMEYLRRYDRGEDHFIFYE